MHPIRPGKPVENSFVESFNGTFRKACLGIHWLEDLDHARHVIDPSRRRCGKPEQLSLQEPVVGL
ncbi:MAG: transposase [Thermoanaerobaculia bacterium]|nr:MAG: transposase [Thermoanaerobaculia bacterium]MBZ0103699.1 transposase [Thermoanaerobaculia bacterium]